MLQNYRAQISSKSISRPLATRKASKRKNKIHQYFIAKSAPFCAIPTNGVPIFTLTGPFGRQQQSEVVLVSVCPLEALAVCTSFSLVIKLAARSWMATHGGHGGVYDFERPPPGGRALVCCCCCCCVHLAVWATFYNALQHDHCEMIGSAVVVRWWWVVLGKREVWGELILHVMKKIKKEF